MASLRERFEEKIYADPNCGCWLWGGVTNDHGYGQLGVRDASRKGGWRMDYAHRISWEMFRGRSPEGVVIRHRCDNPCCVNPDHLVAGTHQDNVSDMVLRDRARRGSLPRGVRKNRESRRFWGQFRFRGKRYYCGTHETPEDAAEAVRLKQEELYGRTVAPAGLTLDETGCIQLLPETSPPRTNS